MAGCWFYTSLWKTSSAVESATFSKNRHCPTLAQCCEKRGGYGEVLFPWPSARIIPGLQKLASSRAQSGDLCPTFEEISQVEGACPVSAVSLIAVKADGNVGMAGQWGGPESSLCILPASLSARESWIALGCPQAAAMQHRANFDSLFQALHFLICHWGSNVWKATGHCVDWGRCSDAVLAFFFPDFPSFCWTPNPQRINPQASIHQLPTQPWRGHRFCSGSLSRLLIYPFTSPSLSFSSFMVFVGGERDFSVIPVLPCPKHHLFSPYSGMAALSHWFYKPFLPCFCL